MQVSEEGASLCMHTWSSNDLVINMSIDVAALLASAKASSSGSTAETILKAARRADPTELARAIAARGGSMANLDAKGAWDGMAAIHWAAEKGSAECARLLLEANAGPNTRDGQQFTPLMIAAQKNHLDVVRVLLSHGADWKTNAKGKMTAADLAFTPEMKALLGGKSDTTQQAECSKAPVSSRTRAKRNRS